MRQALWRAAREIRDFFHSMKKTALLLAILLSGLAPLAAQESLPQVVEIQRAYDGLKFEEAEALARQALARAEEYSPADLVQIHLLMAYLGFVQKRMTAVRQHFESALSLQPGLTLDSLLVSPRIVRLFEQVKNEYRVGIVSATPTVKYIVVKDQRLAGLRRSLLLPGWGQRHLRRPAAGWIYTTGFVLALGAGLALQVLQEQAHDRYRNAATPADIAAAYDRFNQRYRLRNAAFVSAAGIYAINILDLLLLSPAPSPLAAASPGTRSLKFTLQVPFGALH